MGMMLQPAQGKTCCLRFHGTHLPAKLHLLDNT